MIDTWFKKEVTLEEAIENTLWVDPHLGELEQLQAKVNMLFDLSKLLITEDHIKKLYPSRYVDTK